MAERKQSPLRAENIQPQTCSHHRRLEILSHTPFFAALAPDAMAEINRHFREEGYDSGGTIYAAGDAAQRLYIVAAGKIKLVRHSLSGQDALLAILSAGDYFGSLSTVGNATYPDTAQAQTTACVLGIDVQALNTLLLKYPPVAIAVLHETAQRLQNAQETIRQLSAYPVERRIATILLALAEKLGEESDGGLLIQVPLSRQELADMAGATVETTSRVISKLEHSGVVRSGRQWIVIADGQRLAALAQER